MRSFALAIVGAEYVLGWLPKGTHDWEKFVTPDELRGAVEGGGLSVTDTTGVVFKPAHPRWSAARDTAVNYMIAAEKPRPDEATSTGLLSFAHEMMRGDRSMLEKIPHAVGEALSGLRAGLEKTACRAEFEGAPAAIRVTSPAFARVGAAGSLHPGRSQALAAARLERDSVRHRRPGAAGRRRRQPTPKPIVHAIAWDLDPTSDGLAEGALASPGSDGTIDEVGKNTFLGRLRRPTRRPATARTATCSRLYALNRHLGLEGVPGRGALLEAMHGHVLAKGGARRHLRAALTARPLAAGCLAPNSREGLGLPESAAWPTTRRQAAGVRRGGSVAMKALLCKALGGRKTW